MKLSENICPKCGKISPQQLGQVSFGNAPVKCIFCGHEYYLDLTETALNKVAEASKKGAVSTKASDGKEMLSYEETFPKINYKLFTIKEDELKTELERRNRDGRVSEMSLTVKEILSKSTFAGFSTEELENELLRRRRMGK